MRETEEFVKDFMERYSSGKYPKIHQTNDRPELNDSFVSTEVSSFSRLLDSELADDIMSGSKSLNGTIEFGILPE